MRSTDDKSHDDMVNQSTQSLTDSFKQKLGEDLVLEKINRIFDEVKREH